MNQKNRVIKKIITIKINRFLMFFAKVKFLIEKPNTNMRLNPQKLMIIFHMTYLRFLLRLETFLVKLQMEHKRLQKSFEMSFPKINQSKKKDLI